MDPLMRIGDSDKAALRARLTPESLEGLTHRSRGVCWQTQIAQPENVQSEMDTEKLRALGCVE